MTAQNVYIKIWGSLRNRAHPFSKPLFPKVSEARWAWLRSRVVWASRDITRRLHGSDVYSIQNWTRKVERSGTVSACIARHLEVLDFFNYPLCHGVKRPACNDRVTIYSGIVCLLPNGSI